MNPPTPRRRFVDLSIYLENDVLSDPPPLAPKITYQKHVDTLPEFMAMLPGTQPEDYPDGEAAAAEWVTLTTHNGTHLDAPVALPLHAGREERRQPSEHHDRPGTPGVVLPERREAGLPPLPGWLRGHGGGRQERVGTHRS
jgi:hypothetical protein